MANPLYNALKGNYQPPQYQGGQEPVRQSEAPQNANTAAQTTFQDAMRQLQANPAQIIKQAGYNVPDQYANDPQSATMYLIQSGQVGGPMMKMIAPMLSRLTGRR